MTPSYGSCELAPLVLTEDEAELLLDLLVAEAAKLGAQDIHAEREQDCLALIELIIDLPKCSGE